LLKRVFEIQEDGTFLDISMAIAPVKTEAFLLLSDAEFVVGFDNKV
jgi:hypothetical protein